LLLPTIERIRRRNAQSLTERIGTTAFADITGIGPARASHLVGQNPSRNIGHKTARRIERAFGKPEGWLDADHARSIEAAVNRLSALESPYDDERDTRIWQDALTAAIHALHRLQA
jgi:plasmid maintenance system antidote protein VapI